MSLSDAGNWTQRRVALACWFACMLAGSQLVFASGSISGYVLNQATHDPIPGVTVTGSWRGFAIENSTCVWVDVSTTDTHGRYEIPAPSLTFSQKFIESTNPHVDLYKPGYAYARPTVEKGLPSTLYMTANVDERVRMQEIRDNEHAATCIGTHGQQDARLLPLYRALFDDAMSLPPEIRDPLLLKSICRVIAAVEPKCLIRSQ